MTKKQKLRDRIFNKYGGRCSYCGCDLQKGWHVDHKEPVYREWWKTDNSMERPENDVEENMMPSCPSCNINKHSLSIEDFRNAIYQYVISLKKYSVQYKMASKYGIVTETGKDIVFYFEKCEINGV